MVMATYVIINILMAFVIDVYTSIEDAHQNEKQAREDVIKFSINAIKSEEFVERSPKPNKN